MSIEADKLRGMWVDPRLGRVTFGEWAAEVQQTKMTRRPATVYRVESMLRSLVLPTFGEMILSSIRPVTVRRWIADLVDAGYAPTTVRTAHALLSTVLKDAVRDGRLPKSPAEDTPLPKVEHREMRFLSHDETGNLAEAVDPRYRALVLTAGYTGLRFGELAGLEVRHPRDAETDAPGRSGDDGCRWTRRVGSRQDVKFSSDGETPPPPRGRTRSASCSVPKWCRPRLLG